VLAKDNVFNDCMFETPGADLLNMLGWT